MRPLRLVSLCTSLLSTMVLAQSASVISQSLVTKSAVPSVLSQPDPAMQAKVADSYGKLPLSFEANHGQADGRVKFLSRTGSYTLFLTGDEAMLALRAGKAKNKFPVETRLAASQAEAKSNPIPESMPGAVLRMKLRNANPAAKITGTDELAGTSNYFIGNDPTKWRTNVPTYARVKYEGIYSGIDLVYYGNQRQLEYDFIVSPGADPHRIAFDVRGAKRIRSDAQGDLVLRMETGEDEIRWHKPVVYQEKNGARQEIAASYAITDRNRVGFELAKYDASRPLYIDPLIYSTYLGGNYHDAGYGIAIDSAGNAYVSGYTSSTDFVTKNPLQGANAGKEDVFVAKINAAGSALVYSTYLGGSSDDEGDGIAVDSAGNAYVTGTTASTDFPLENPLQGTFGGGGQHPFVAKLNATGTALVYSTYVGGSDNDYGYGIAVDSSGNAYVTGGTYSTDFPTKNPLQAVYGGNFDAFVSKIDSAGSALVYSTYLGGSQFDVAYGIAVDSAGNAYVAGLTASTNFPIINPLQGGNAGGFDAFVAKLNPTGSGLVYSTYLGGSNGDQGNGIAVDSSGNAYISGYTQSTNFPTKNPLQGAYAGNEDVFVAKINAAGSALLYSTYLGGSGWDYGSAIAVDSAGNAYVTGFTYSTDFPTTTNAAQPTFGGGYNDAFVTKLNPTGSALLYSSYLGGSDGEFGTGIAVDSSGNPYVTGQTASTNFPTENPLQPTYGGGTSDAFVAKTSVPAETPTTTTLSSSPNPSAYGQAVTFTAVVTSSIGAPPDGETVTFMEGATILGTGALSGGSASFTTSALPVGTDSIKVVYGGDSKFLGSKSNTVSHVVSKATSTTSLVSSRNPSNSGQSVTFTASVAPQFSGTPTGKVTFLNGTTFLATKALSNGTASFTTSKLPPGSNIITAVYGGDSNFASSTSAQVNQFVLATTTITLSSSPNPSSYGQAVTFTATVTSSIGAPPNGETVTFMKGTTVLGTGVLSGGSASFTTSTLKVGTNLITAVYGGDSNFAASKSKAVSQVVNKATTTTTLASSLNPSNFGQSVTFTASVAPQYSGPVKGTVTFYDGTTALKTVGLSGGLAKFTTSTLTSGAHRITATYNGNTNFTGSSASLTQTVN